MSAVAYSADIERANRVAQWHEKMAKRDEAGTTTGRLTRTQQSDEEVAAKAEFMVMQLQEKKERLRWDYPAMSWK